MPQTILITRPFYDPTTSYLYYWSLNIIASAKSKGMKICDLHDKRSNKKELMSVIKKLNPELILLNGHGGEDRILGQDGEILVKINDNEHILKDAIVYALSCKSARLLGRLSVGLGTKAYIGYTEDFIFCTSDAYSTRPKLDPIAKLFLEPTNVIADLLIAGNSAKNSEKRGKEEFSKNIKTVLSTDSSEEYLARFLVWDMINQVCLGDQDASV